MFDLYKEVRKLEKILALVKSTRYYEHSIGIDALNGMTSRLGQEKMEKVYTELRKGDDK